MSILQDPDRATEFSDLLRNTVSKVRPSVVIASGDLTDARTGLFSEQHGREWHMYIEAVKSSGLLKDTAWLDIRGNHDTFNVATYAEDFFSNYSIQGATHRRSYSHQTTVNGDKYTFVGVDAALVPGPKRPFNFLGSIDAQERAHIEALLDQSRASESDYLIWFGHYPTSCIMSPGVDSNMRSLIGEDRQSLVYLCGHLHTFSGVVPRMYALQNAGFLELELGDWKRSRMFRWAAVDHGLFSFVDVHYNTFPIILITNPKDSERHIPDREDMSISLASTHIRILAFSNAPITECRVQIGGHTSSFPCHASDTVEHLYTAAWDPRQYDKGSHTITVVITDSIGRSNTVSHQFCLDGNSVKPSFGFLSKIILMWDMRTIFKGCFVFAYLICVLPLVYCKFRGSAIIPHSKGWSGKLALLSSVDRLFYPLMAFYVYFLLGPWMVGEVIDGQLGWVFLWGIYIKGTILPGTLSYLYGFFQLLLCQFWLLVIFANMVAHRFRCIQLGLRSPRRSIRSEAKFAKKRYFWPHFPFALIITTECLLAIVHLKYYGFFYFLLGAMRFWSVALHLVVFYLAYTLDINSLKRALNWRRVQGPTEGIDLR